MFFFCKSYLKFFRAEINKLPEAEFRWYGREILKHYDNWVQSGRRGCYYTDLHRVPSAAVKEIQNPVSNVTEPSDNFVLKNPNHPSDPNKAVGFYFVE